jgi:hypothetical protein
MAGVKYQEHIFFPEGHIYVLMDDEWGVEITGENGIGGDLVGMGGWDFSTREAWTAWGDYCIEYIRGLQKSYEAGKIDEYDVTELVYTLDDLMDDTIKASLVEA